MKRLFIAALLLMGTLSTSFGQSSLSDSNRDFYRNLAKAMRYPATSSIENKVAKAYVLFNVNELGKVADVSVLNATNVDSPFIQEITRVMNVLPVQPKLTAGTYVLPIEFILEGEGKSIKPREENKSFVQFVSEKKLLESLIVVGYGKS